MKIDTEASHDLVVVFSFGAGDLRIISMHQFLYSYRAML